MSLSRVFRAAPELSLRVAKESVSIYLSFAELSYRTIQSLAKALCPPCYTVMMLCDVFHLP